ncbi:hypothetical protein WH95_15515 [Kiloniella litopenaei]|uniref:Glutamine amidotransferase domain-containing protein n=1 Tax=Kiloniella litopenaei TaxID=1549748 RepID=A0A0M2R2S8_9PROT|nr:glutamine amidotransferase [Kiloniella litopenaei]KKJ75971.1 hypothetical protein WH95_15515 [Kiloniella litopenaei]
MKSVLVIRHVSYEDLDGFDIEFRNAGYKVAYHDAWYDKDPIDALEPDILVVLGAPCGVYETENFPFIQEELKAVAERVEAGKPVLGICFGAQLLAQALGSTVYVGDSFEFGWSPLTLTQAGRHSPINHYATQNREVFHCHGDTFKLPEGATLLASTPSYKVQAFSYGPHLAMQFHGEVTERGLRRWFIGHIGRIHSMCGLPHLVKETARVSPTLEALHRSVLQDWLAQHENPEIQQFVETA